MTEFTTKLLDDARFGHFFNCREELLFLQFNFPNLSKADFSDNEL